MASVCAGNTCTVGLCPQLRVRSTWKPQVSVWFHLLEVIVVDGYWTAVRNRSVVANHLLCLWDIQSQGVSVTPLHQIVHTVLLWWDVVVACHQCQQNSVIGGFYNLIFFLCGGAVICICALPLRSHRYQWRLCGFDSVEGWGEVNEDRSGKGLWLAQVFEDEVKECCHGNLCAPPIPVGELVGLTFSPQGAEGAAPPLFPLTSSQHHTALSNTQVGFVSGSILRCDISQYWLSLWINVIDSHFKPVCFNCAQNIWSI